MDVPGLARYLTGLAENNNRAWFEANRDQYRLLRDDFYVFLDELIGRIGEFDERVRHADPKAAAFRMFRDTRFSRDKSPYRTNFAATISEGRRGHEAPGYFVQMDSRGVVFHGGGIFMPPAPVLGVIRDHIAARPERLRAVLERPAFSSRFGDLQGERLKRAPRGFAEDAPMVEYLKLKSFVVTREIPAGDGDVMARLVESYRTMHPLVEWIREALAADS